MTNVVVRSKGAIVFCLPCGFVEVYRPMTTDVPFVKIASADGPLVVIGTIENWQG
jgi:hypothetical protein